MKVQKDEFETNAMYNERFQQAYTFFISQLKSKGINIDNAYSVKINKKSIFRAGYEVSYDAEKEIVTIRIESDFSWRNKYAVLGIESASTEPFMKDNEYNLAIENINSGREEILSFSLGRNEARKLISNNILGVAIVCKFIPPFVDVKSDFDLRFSPKPDMVEITKKYIIANAKKIVIYNIKNGKIYSESSISDRLIP
jgi:hypothetical protein